jgi:hypothetical protein
MKVGPKLIALALLILVVAGACASGSSNESIDGPTEVAGPALVMFYTDN